MSTESKKYFTWTDAEISLLLHIVVEYKADKAKENRGYYWDTCRTKYEDICKNFVEAYPKSSDEKEKFPQAGKAAEVFDKAKIKNKVGKLRSSYLAAKSQNRKSGNGRIITMFFNTMEEIWEGSPCADKIPNAIESAGSRPDTDLDDGNEEQSINTDERSADADGQSINIDGQRPSNTDDGSESEPEAEERDTANKENNVLSRAMNTFEKQSSALTEQLNKRRNDKLQKVIPKRMKMSLAEEESLKLRREQLDFIKQANERHDRHMTSILDSLTTLTGAIAARNQPPNVSYVGPGVSHYTSPEPQTSTPRNRNLRRFANNSGGLSFHWPEGGDDEQE